MFAELKQKDRTAIRHYTSRELTNNDYNILVRNIALSIEAELSDSAYYRELADIAPDFFAADIINEFSHDEREHAYYLQQAYEALTGCAYNPPGEMEYEFDIEDYQKALEKRILNETADLKKYKGYYLMTNNPILRDIFFNNMQDEVYHAIRIMYLIHMNMMRRMNMGNDSMSDIKEMMCEMMNMMENMMNMMREMNRDDFCAKSKGKKAEDK